MNEIMRNYDLHKDAAERAYVHFLDLYPNAPRVPGCSTVIRLAQRIAAGRSEQEAAAREYLYRWHLALIPSPRNAGLFGVPHALGM